jgi:hypothetical protein
MPKRIGPKGLQRLIDAGVALRTLELEQRFQAFRTMGRLLLAPPACTPKRLRPRCGARCRDGHRCQAKAVWDEDHDCPVNGRCRVHGGLSTGPRTPEGRQRIGAAARLRAQARRMTREQAARVEGQEHGAVLLSPQEQEQAQAQALTSEQVEALGTYRRALAYYELTRWTEAWKDVARAYQRCRDRGVDPRA